MIVLVGLFDILKVKELTLRNRIVMPPMASDLATDRGAVTEKLVEHYKRRAKGLGLIIVEHSYVSPEGKAHENQLAIYDDSFVLGLEKLSKGVHSAGTPILLQISHGGGKVEIAGIQPVAPSSTQDARELKAAEIDALAEKFARASERAVKAGFDGVELHGAHGFLLNQFYSPLSNKRRDKYGGSLENRIRFPLEVVGRVKKKVGRRLLLYRMGADDLSPNGTTIEDSKIFAVKLQESGVDIIDVSGGLCGDGGNIFQGTQGYFIPQAKEIKKVVDVPVIGVGGILDPEYADRLINEGTVDLVAIGRGIMHDPDWATKAIRKLKTKI